MANMKAKAIQPKPEDAVFSQFVHYVVEHKELPDLTINGNMGVHHKNAVRLRTAFVNGGVEDFQAVLKAVQKNDLDANRALSIPASTNSDDQPVGTLLSEVKPEKINWLWKPRLARRKLTMLDGDPGLGKSIITIDLAARVTRGRAMPGEATPCIQGGVVLVTPEDGLSDTIQPRLARAGADLTKVVSIGTIQETTKDGYTYDRPFTLPEDLSVLEKAIKRVNAVLVIIDPVMAILGTKDTYKDNEVRSLLAPVQMLIEKTEVCCILVRHLTKGGGDNPLYRGVGSIAFNGLVRTALMVVPDPNIENQCVLAHFKSNINKLGSGLTYTVVSDDAQGDDRPYITWGGTSNLSLSEMLVPPRKNTGSNRQDVLEVLQKHAPNEMSIAQIHDLLPDITLNNLKVLLKRMYDSKEIKKSERGAYHA